MVVFAEGAGSCHVQAERVLAARPLQVGDEAAQLSLAEIGIDVAFVERRQVPVGDHVAADDRAAAAAAVRVGEDRLDRAARVGGAAVRAPIGGEALERVPAEIGAVGYRHGRVVELLEAILADVADRDSGLLRRHRVEGEAERIAQAIAVDLRLGAGPPRVDSQQLAEQLVAALRVVWRIAARAAVAAAEVEPVAEELQLAAVVIGVDWVGYLHHSAAGAPRGSRRAPTFELVDADVALGVGVVDVEAATAHVVRREGDREQSALATGGDQVGDVEERLALPMPAAQDDDLAFLLDDEEQLGETGSAGDVDRALELADPLQADAGLGRARVLLRLLGGSARRQGQREERREDSCLLPPSDWLRWGSAALERLHRCR